MTVSIAVNPPVSSILSSLSNLERKQFPFAFSRAINDTADDVHEAWVKDMALKFDKPTRWTLNSMFVKRSHKRQRPIQAHVLFKEFAGKGTPGYKYIRPHVFGGGRNQKASERQLAGRGLMTQHRFWVPGSGARLNRHDNITGGAITKILSGLQAQRDPQQNSSKRGKKTFFVPKTGSKLRAGVWQRMANRRIKPVLIFISNAVYRKRFQWYPLANQVVRKQFPKHFKKRLREAVKTAFKKRG